MLSKIKSELKKVADPKKIPILSNFFKTGIGQYGEGDKFLGITVPDQRNVAKKYNSTSLFELEKLLHSQIHEERLTSLLILVEQFENADSKQKKILFDFYMKNGSKVNNWDLVDLTAPKIAGVFMFDNPSYKTILYKFAKSSDLWERRIAIVSTWTFIRNNQFDDTIKISEMLLNDKHDLIHKAVGWMLREVGKKDINVLYKFLDRHARVMPRTMLRYSVEKLDEDKKDYYMSK